jgi:hypothetical protein
MDRLDSLPGNMRLPIINMINRFYEQQLLQQQQTKEKKTA